MDDIYQEIVRVKAEGEEAALVTVVSASGSTPREEGAKMLVRPDGSIMGTIGGGSLEARAIGEAVKVIKQAKPKRLHMSLTTKEAGEVGMICGGELEVFIEPILTPPALFIFGGGHISLPLARMGKLVGFNIAVIDDRAEFASAERFPEADVILAEDFTKSFARVKIDKSSYIVIVTRGHQHDEVVLEWAVGTPAKYIGMIGSKTKNETIFSHLLARGISREQLDRVYAPIGLEIEAQTPEEIAVSILAEVIKVRRSS
ncbi:MAG: XdhC family protein [Deltaproteobacteria bacterium]|nr:XdhC family protein [Deltaproteobacteria bacterium]